mgnify:CR=1 FL=1
MLRLTTIFLLLFLCHAFGKSSESELYRSLIFAARKGDTARVCALLEKVGPNPSSKLVRLLLELGVKLPSKEGYLAVRKALQKIRGEEGLSVLGQTAAKSRIWQYRVFAVIALGDNPDPRTTGYLIPLLKDKDLRIRIRAAQALGRKACREAVDSLVGILPQAGTSTPSPMKSSPPSPPTSWRSWGEGSLPFQQPQVP